MGNKKGMVIDGNLAKADTPLMPHSVAQFDCAFLDGAPNTSNPFSMES
jgi:hypothetical protein